MNVTIFALGITNSPNLQYLSKLVSTPVEEHLGSDVKRASESTNSIANLLAWKICHHCVDPVDCLRERLVSVSSVSREVHVVMSHRCVQLVTTPRTSCGLKLSATTSLMTST